MRIAFSASSVVSMVSAVQHVNRLPEGGLRALHDPLRQGGMRVYGERDVRDRRAHLDREGEFADQVARVRTDNRRAEEDLGVGVGEELHEAVVLARREGAADRRERHPADAHLTPLGGRLRLLHPDRGDFGVREDGGGHRAIVDLDGMAGDHLRRDEAFLRRLVREERRADHVADREDVRIRRPQLPVHLDVSPRPDLDAAFVGRQIVRVRATSDGHEDQVRAAGDQPIRRDDVDDRLVLVHPPAARLRLHVDLDAELLQAPRDDANRVEVRPRQDLVHDLDHDDAAAELRVERADLEPGDAAADDREVRRDAGELERFLRAQDLLAIEAEGGQVGRSAARRDDRVRERDVLGDARASDVHAAGSGERCLSGEDLHAVPLAQLADSVHEPLHDGRLPRLQPSHVDLDRSGLDASFGGALDRLNEVPRVDEGLARDAAVVQAFAAELVPLDEEDVLAELRRADRRGIATGAGPDHHDVDENRRGVLQVVPHRLHERGADVAVDHAVVEGAGEVHHLPDDDVVVTHDGPLLDFVDTEDRDLGPVDDRRREDAALLAEGGDRERRALDVRQGELLVARRAREAVDLPREVPEVPLVRVVDHGDRQALVRRGGDPDVVVPPDDDLPPFVVDGRVQGRELRERCDDGFDEEREERQLDPLAVRRLLEVVPQRHELGHVDLLDVRERGGGRVRLRHLLEDPLPQAEDRDALLRAGRCGRSDGGSRWRDGPLRPPAYVVLRDPSLRPAPSDRGEVDVQLPREATDRGGREDLPGNGRRRRRGGHPDRGGGSGGWHGRGGGSRRRHRLARFAEDDERRADLHDLAFLRPKLQDLARDGRGDLHRHLVRHHFDDGIVLLDSVPFFHEPLDDLALVDALPDVGELELAGHLGRQDPSAT